MQSRYEAALERMSKGRLAVTDWADGDIDGRAIAVLCHVLQHLHRSEEQEDVFLADRLAVLSLARATERPVEGKALAQLVEMAAERLSEQKDRWSRRALNSLGVQRTLNLLHLDRSGDGPREDCIPVDSELPRSIAQRRGDPLHAIVDFPGCEALGLKVKDMIHEENGRLLLRTDAWSPKNLVELRPGAYPYGDRR